MPQAPVKHVQPEAFTYRRIEVQRCSPGIGAEISGIDLSKPLDRQTVEEIRHALLDHLVIFFRDQDIDRESHKALGRWFGELHRHPGATLPGNDAEMTRIHADETTKVVAGGGRDHRPTFDPPPARGAHPAPPGPPPSRRDHALPDTLTPHDALSRNTK